MYTTLVMNLKQFGEANINIYQEIYTSTQFHNPLPTLCQIAKITN